VGQAVPADDLPSATGVPVPPDDLPGAPAPVAAVTTPHATQQSGLDLSYFDPRGVPEAALSVGTGMAGQALGGLAGLVGAALPGEQGQGARVAERVSSALTYTPRTKSGQGIVDIASLPGRAVEGVASKVGEEGERVSPGLATVGKTAVHALPLLLGARQATTPAPKLTPAQERVAAARDAGFKMTPEEMGAGPVSRTAASISGEPRLARGISKKNQPLVLEKVKRDLGVPDGVELDLDTIAKVRKQAGMVHEEARGMGQVTAGKEYFADLDKLGQKYTNAAKDFPELAATDVQAVIEGARKPVFSSSGAVDLISQLRESASQAFAARQSGLGKVYRGVSEAIETELGRHIQANAQAARLSGDVQLAGTLDSLLKRYQSARTTIAKAHLAEDALLADDVINPRVLGTAAREGKPVTGEMGGAANFAKDFERSSLKPSTMGTGATAHDIALAFLQRVGRGAGNFGLDLATLGARPALRAMLSSRGGQALMDPRTRISSGAAQAVGAGSVPRPQEKTK
jgi:hypothetical protein